MPTAFKILHPSILLPPRHSPTAMFTSPALSRRSSDSTSFTNLRLHRLLELVLTERPTAAPILDQLLSTLHDVAVRAKDEDAYCYAARHP